MQSTPSPQAPAKRRAAGNFFYLLGARQWWKILRDNRFAVEPKYWPRAAAISVASCKNSIEGGLVARRELSTHRAAVADAKIQSPIFIIGHWRSGTTHLHNLLTCDQRFAFPDNYECFFPLRFLDKKTGESRLAKHQGEAQLRLMDDMEISLHSPQEDEFALCLMTGLSYYSSMAFPKNRRSTAKYLSLESLAVSETEKWKAALRLFLRRLTVKYNRPLVLKSPTHTARLKLLLEMFPDARFVHIHRHPYEVFQSCMLAWPKLRATRALQSSGKFMAEDILFIYNALYDAFFEQRASIPARQFYELRFSDIENEPMQQLEAMYEHLGLPDFSQTAPTIQAHLDSQKNYQKTPHEPLSTEWEQRIAHEWKRSFETWGYEA